MGATTDQICKALVLAGDSGPSETLTKVRLLALESELAAAQAAIAPPNVYTVGPAGSGAQYQTVQSAIDAIPALGSGEGERSGTWVVRVLPGEYAEAVKVYKSQVVLELLPGSLVVSEDATWAGNMEIVPSFPILVVASDVLVTGGGEAFNPSDTGSSCAVVIGLNAETGEVGEGWEIAPHRVTVARIRARGRHRDTIVVTNSASEDCAINGCYVEGYYDVISASGTRSSVVSNRVKTSHPTNGTRGGAPFWAGRFGSSEAGCKAMFAFNVCEFDGSRWINITGQADVMLDNNTMVTDSGIARQPVNIAAAGTGGLAATGTLRLGNQPHSGDVWAAGSEQTVTLHRLTTRTGAVVSDGEVTANATGTPRTLSTAIQQSTLTAKGSILTATAANTPAALAVPSTAGPWILRPASGAATGLEWIQRGVVWQTLEDSATLNGSVSTERDFSQTYTLPANALVAGSMWKIAFDGLTKGNGTSETLTLRLYLGSTVLINTFARSTQNSNWETPLRLPILFAVRTAGATGSVCTFQETTYILYWFGSTIPPALHTINTTVPLVLKATAQWSGTNAANEAKLLSARLERLA